MDPTVIAPTIETTLRVTSADVTAMLVQAHIDQLQAREDAIREELRANTREFDAIDECRLELIQAAFEAKRPKIEALIALIADLGGWQQPLAPRLTERSLTSHKHALFYLNGGKDFKNVLWEAEWEIYVKSRAGLLHRGEDDEGDEDDDEDTILIEGGSERTDPHRISVRIPSEMKARIIVAIDQRADINARLQKIKEELSNVGKLERKTAAALTRQLLKKSPTLLAQLDDAIQEMGRASVQRLEAKP